MYSFLCDIHLGTKLPNEDQMKSLDMFLDLIRKHKEPCHCIFVCGDLFDHRLSIDEARFASLYLLKLVCNHCGEKEKHVPVHFIHGTYTHDYEQYKIFLPILEKIDGTNIFYAETVCAKQLWSNGPTVLYLPQEYGNIDYDEAFSHTYDIIVGHGPISSSMLSPCKSKSEEIVHSADLLGEISKICVFGHFHGYTDFGNNVYYAGPLLQWKYGEDIPKRFFFCNDNYEVETVLNPYAMEFKTIEIYDPESLRTILSEEIKTPHRFMIHSDINTLSTYHGIMNANKKNRFLTYRIISESSQNTEKTLNVLNATTPDIAPVPSLIKYIDDKYGIDTTEEIHEYENRIRKDESK